MVVIYYKSCTSARLILQAVALLILFILIVCQIIVKQVENFESGHRNWAFGLEAYGLEAASESKRGRFGKVSSIRERGRSWQNINKDSHLDMYKALNITGIGL